LVCEMVTRIQEGLEDLQGICSCSRTKDTKDILLEAVVQEDWDVDLEDLQGRVEVLQPLEAEEEQLEGQQQGGGREERDREEEEEQMRLVELLGTNQLQLQQLLLL